MAQYFYRWSVSMWAMVILEKKGFIFLRKQHKNYHPPTTNHQQENATFKRIWNNSIFTLADY